MNRVFGYRASRERQVATARRSPNTERPRHRPVKLIATGMALCCLAGATLAEPHNTLTAAEAEAGWQLLFSGSNLDNWRNYGKETLDGRWVVENGTLSLTGAGGGDIITRDTFGNFELQLDWRISEGGNSGIFFLVEESDQLIYFKAPEIQILDNDRHSDREIDSHRSGALYDLVAPHPLSQKPQGEWNSVRIRFEDGLLNVWQNDVPTVAIVIGSSTWNTLIENSKFASWEGFGTGTSGHIGLQDHDDQVWFRNIKILALD